MNSVLQEKKSKYEKGESCHTLEEKNKNERIATIYFQGGVLSANGLGN